MAPAGQIETLGRARLIRRAVLLFGGMERFCLRDGGWVLGLVWRAVPGV